MELGQVTDKLYNWASVLDENTRQQALQSSRVPIVWPHIALMPDAHLGIGGTVGSVVPTRGGIIPSTVGVDWGCGMEAWLLDLHADQLPDNLEPLLQEFARSIPTGPGGAYQANRRILPAQRGILKWLDATAPQTDLTTRQKETAYTQLGTLGSGNHFLEVVTDEENYIWLFLHSGSRGIGNQLATWHIKRGQEMAQRGECQVEHPDLAYFLEGTPDFDHFIGDMLWGQMYALMNRQYMITEAHHQLGRFLAKAAGRDFDTYREPKVLEKVSCHHNYAGQETHCGETLWVTRKGAISAAAGRLGLIPGSMGTASYVVRGLGNPLSFNSAPHGAGRLRSRGDSRRNLSVEHFEQQMAGKVWLRDRAAKLLDEAPDAYKDIEQVMADAGDLVEMVHSFTQIVNFKG